MEEVGPVGKCQRVVEMPRTKSNAMDLGTGGIRTLRLWRLGTGIFTYRILLVRTVQFLLP